MNTVAYLFIFAAIVLLRAVARGRAANITEDVSDAFLAFVRGDARGFREVANRTGDSLSAPEALPAATQGTSGVSAFADSTGGAIAKNAVRRGSLARGYKLGATGPDYYDCSGLMWRACMDARAYKGIRFTTATIGAIKQFTRVDTPRVDDLVVWPRHHMGVVTGDDRFYSAMNSRDGIGYARISTWSGGKQGKPVYYRPTTVEQGSAEQGAGGGGAGSW